jgi:hypothetical protein
MPIRLVSMSDKAFILAAITQFLRQHYTIF